MHPLRFVGLVFLVTAACSRGEVALRGSLADVEEGEQQTAQLVGHSEATQVFDSTFEMSGLPPGPLELRIGTNPDRLARMNIADLPAGASLSLERIRVDEDERLAFPSAVQLEGADLVSINGIRMAGPEALSGRVKQDGTVLAMNRRGDRLLVRPGDTDLPDLPIVITSATLVTNRDGDTASLGEVSPGDSMRVEGRARSGYLYAERIVAEARFRPDEDRRTGPSGLPGEREEDDDGEKRDKQRGKREKGKKGRGEIPAGHQPPPGECRDWNPDLPPGQQPPPRKC